MAAGSIAQTLSALDTARLSAIYAINNKGVSISSTAGFNAFPDAISAISGGGGGQFEFYATSLYASTFTCSFSGSIRPYAFASMRNGLKVVSFPNAYSVGSYAFEGTSIEVFSLPSCATVGSSAFRNCDSLYSIDLPMCSYINKNAFECCSNLSSVYLSICKYLCSSAFISCYRLTTLKLFSNRVATLFDTNVFDSTPIAGYTSYTGGVYGSIYVPSSLYESYISANRWSAFSARFVSM